MHVAFIYLLAEQHEDKAGYRDKGAERKRMALLLSNKKQASADDEPKNRGDYYDVRLYITFCLSIGIMASTTP